VLPKGGYQFRRTRYDASAAFSIPSGAGDICLYLLSFSTLIDIQFTWKRFALNNRTPNARDREADFLLSASLERRPSALGETMAECVWVTP
jgi:hypothetical protein